MSNKKTFQPTDGNSNEIPVLRYDTPHQVSVRASTHTNVNAFDGSTKVLAIYSPESIFFKQTVSASGVITTASAHYLPGGILRDISMMGNKGEPYKYIKTITAGTDTILYVSELA